MSVGVDTFARQILKAKTRVEIVTVCLMHPDIDLVMIFKGLYYTDMRQNNKSGLSTIK